MQHCRKIILREEVNARSLTPEGALVVLIPSLSRDCEWEFAGELALTCFPDLALRLEYACVQEGEEDVLVIGIPEM